MKKKKFKKAPEKESKKKESKNIVEEKRMGFIDKFYHDNHKRLLIIPFAMLLIALIVLGVNFATTGSLIDMDVSLSGGLTITIPSSNASIIDINNDLESKFTNDIMVREIAEFGQQKAITIAVSADQNDDLEALEKSIISELSTFLSTKDYSVEIIGPTLGASFLQQTLIALLAAFIFMALTVFYYFRTFIPSGAVVLAAFSDMVVTLAIASLMNMKLGTAGIASFLMLIGYSVDTDILLSTRVLKRTEGTVYERIKSAISTGFLMNLTTLAAVITALVITQSEIIAQIMTILLIGLLVDIINTWIQNVGILRWYAEKKEVVK